MIIYIDATGGDNAPGEIVKGAVNAAEIYGVNITLLGEENAVRELAERNGAKGKNISFINAPQLIDMHEEPVKAIRTKKDSALVVGASLIKGDRDSAFISAGSTGAVLTAGTLITGRLAGVKRPALATLLPGNKPTLLIDNGANADCKAEYFSAFAKMGMAYMRAMFGDRAFKVGLINIGAEEIKGNQLYKEAHALLKEDKSIDFIGNVETRDIFNCPADILVCDGFTGNVLLKSIEGTFSFTLSMFKEVFKLSTKNKFAALLIKNDLQNKKNVLDPSSYGGVPLLGINGNMIKAHGSSDSVAIENAVKQAVELVKNDILGKTIECLNN